MERTARRAAYVTPQLFLREQAHRRTVLLGIAALIVFSTSPVFGHHLATRADALLAGRDHLWRLCLIALHHLLAPVHLAFHVALVVGVVWATWDRLRAWRAVSRTLGVLEVRTPAATEPIGAAAVRTGLDLSRVRVVEGLPNPAFTAGFRRPVVYVAAALPELLDGPQLDAVLAHEAAHVARRDPLRLSLLRFLACMVFYIPALRRLADDLADEAEIDADDTAVRRSTPLVLASAILALADRAAPRSAGGVLLPAATVGFLPFRPFPRVDMLDRRVRRLAGESAVVGTHVTRRSLGGAAATLFAVWVSGLMMVHPLPGDAAYVAGTRGEQVIAHCRHPGEFPLTHIFCLGFHARPSGAPCPHVGQ